MDVLLIILIVIAVLVIGLAIGGYVLTGRRRDRERAALVAQTEQADQHLAEAHAQDKGWERSALETAARRIYGERHGGGEPRELQLVQVVDRPGTDEDEAVFMADGAELRLGRRDGEWIGA